MPVHCIRHKSAESCNIQYITFEGQIWQWESRGPPGRVSHKPPPPLNKGPHIVPIRSIVSLSIRSVRDSGRICFEVRLAWTHTLLTRGFIDSTGVRGLEKIEPEFAAKATNFADLIAALRPAWKRGLGNRQPPTREQKCLNSGGLSTEGGVHPLDFGKHSCHPGMRQTTRRAWTSWGFRV